MLGSCSSFWAFYSGVVPKPIRVDDDVVARFTILGGLKTESGAESIVYAKEDRHVDLKIKKSGHIVPVQKESLKLKISFA